MHKTFRKRITNYMETYKTRYYLLLLFFVIGITLGVLFVTVIDANKIKAVNDFIYNFYNNKYDMGSIIYSSFIKNTQTLFFIFLSSLSIFLLPILYGVFLVNGFGIGFTLGFFIIRYGLKGIAVGFCVTFTKIFLWLPIVLFLCVITQDVILHNHSVKDLSVKWSNLKKLLILTLITLLILTMISLIDALCIPGAVKEICGYF